MHHTQSFSWKSNKYMLILNFFNDFTSKCVLVTDEYDLSSKWSSTIASLIGLLSDVVTRPFLILNIWYYKNASDITVFIFLNLQVYFNFVAWDNYIVFGGPVFFWQDHVYFARNKFVGGMLSLYYISARHHIRKIITKTQTELNIVFHF